MTMELTKADRDSLEKLPVNTWFSVDNVNHSVKNPRYRLDRLVERKKLRNKVVGEITNLKTMYIKDVD